MASFEKKTFSGETITLDGNDFIECVIKDNCEVHFLGGPFTLQDTTIGGNVKWGFGGNAVTTLALLRVLRDQKGQKYIAGLLDGINGAVRGGVLSQRTQ